MVYIRNYNYLNVATVHLLNKSMDGGLWADTSRTYQRVPQPAEEGREEVLEHTLSACSSVSGLGLHVIGECGVRSTC